MASVFRSVLKVSAIVLLGVFSSEVAQANDAAALQSIGTESSSDPFSSRGDNTSGMMQMIHRVMQGGGNVDRAEQRESQKENLNEATSDFFTKQRDRLKTTATPSTQVLTPSSPTLVPISPSSALGASGLTSIPQPSTSETLTILVPAAK